jgi:hypothetical protein
MALTRAIAGAAGEGMLVPGELAEALARLLVLYLIATRAGLPEGSRAAGPICEGARAAG